VVHMSHLSEEIHLPGQNMLCLSSCHRPVSNTAAFHENAEILQKEANCAPSLKIPLFVETVVP